MKRQIGRILLIACLLAAAICAAALASPSHTVLVSGPCGSGVSWTVWEDESGECTLEVSGNGPMTTPAGNTLDAGYKNSDLFGCANRIRHILVGEGVTRICSGGFTQFMFDPVTADLPSTCQRVGSYAFVGRGLQSVTLREGLKYIDACAFNGNDLTPTQAQPSCVAVIPRSVLEIGADALNNFVPAVYPGTEGESYCIDTGVANYILLSDTPSAQQTKLLALLDAVMQVEDVPARYRLPVVSTLRSMSLTADQCDTLREYVVSEEYALKLAMVDNSLSIPEITGFVQRFISAMNAVGVQTSYSIKTYNGYPGVRLTVTVNGSGTSLDVYRTPDHYWKVESLNEADDGDFTYVEVADGVMITGYTGLSLHVTFPATLGGKPVVSIADGNYHDELLSVVIPEGVKRIETNAFSHLWDLASVTLPDSLESIGDGAFDDCNSLNSVTFGSHLKSLGNAFNNTGITSVSLPATLESLGRRFDYIEIAPGNPYFESDQGALYMKNPKTLISYPSAGNLSYTVLPGTLKIGSRAFQGNNTIQSVTLPDGLTEIDDYAFYECGHLATVHLPASLTGIGSFAFDSCSSLSSINLPSGLRIIGSFAFAACPGLTFTTLPDSIESIGYEAFVGTTMTNVHVPAMLFSGNAWDWMAGQTNLLMHLANVLNITEETRSFSVGAGNRFFSARGGVLFTADGKNLVRFPPNYQNGAISYTVPGGTLAIWNGAFEDSALSEVLMPEGLISVEAYAFQGCQNLTAINLPSTLTNLGAGCFEGTQIQELTIPEGIRYLYALGCMNSLQRMIIYAPLNGWASDWDEYVSPNSLTVRGYLGSTAEEFALAFGYTFEPFTQVASSVTIQASSPLTVALGDLVTVTATAEDVSDGVIRWSETTTSPVGSLRFTESRGGTAEFTPTRLGSTTLVATAGPSSTPKDTCTVNVVLPSALPARAGTVRFPAGTTEIGPGSFIGTNIRCVIIPSGVTSIGNRTFAGCVNLRIVQIPDSVTYIASNAFDNCPNLTFICGSNSYTCQYANDHGISHYFSH